MARRAAAKTKSEKTTASEESLRIEYVPLGDLKRWPRNPKDHALGTIGASLRRFGMVETPVIDERTGRLVAGHGRIEQLQAEKNARLAPPRRIRVREGDGEWLVPILRGASFRDEREAEAYLLASNQTTIEGGWNDKDLALLLGDLIKQGDDALVGTGFSDADVATMMVSLAASELGALSGGGGSTPDSPEDYDGDESDTPKIYVDAAREVLGEIDLDPFSCAIAQRRIKARKFYTKKQDGLSKEWTGRIWFQPPYSQPTIALAVEKLLSAVEDGAHVVGLTNVASDTQWWQSLSRMADLVCFVSGRIGFDQLDESGEIVETSNNRYAQWFFYAGPSPEKFRSVFEKFGVVGQLRQSLQTTAAD